MEKNKALYDTLSKDYDLGDYDTFSKGIEDAGKRKALYDTVSSDYDLGDYYSFEQKLGFNSKSPVPTLPEQPGHNFDSGSYQSPSDLGQGFINQADMFGKQAGKLQQVTQPNELPLNELHDGVKTSDSKDSYLGDMADKFGAGTLRTIGGMYSIANKMANLPDYVEKQIGEKYGKYGKAFADAVLPLKDVRTAYKEMAQTDMFSYLDGKSIKQAANKLSAEGDRYGTNEDGSKKTFIDLWKEGDYSGAAGDIFLQATESLPQSLAIIGATIAGGGTPALLGAGLISADEKYDSLSNEKPDMNEALKMSNAILTGAAEALTERLGDVPVGKWLGKTYGIGTDAGKEALKNGLFGWVDGMMKKYGLVMAPIEEGTEEFVNQIAGNIIDKATGVNTDGNLTDGALEAFVYGAGGGMQFSAMGAPKMAYDRLKKIGKKTAYADPESKRSLRYAYDVALDELTNEDMELVGNLVGNRETAVFSDPSQRERLEAYWEAKDAYYGLLEGVEEKITAQVDEAVSQVQSNVNPDMNALVSIKLTNDKEVQVVGGTLETNDDGSINRSSSSPVVIIENGERKVIPAKEVLEVLSNTPAEEAIETTRIQTEEQATALEVAEIEDEPLNLKIGDAFENNAGEYVVNGMTPEGLYIIQTPEGKFIEADDNAIRSLQAQKNIETHVSENDTEGSPIADGDREGLPESGIVYGAPTFDISSLPAKKDGSLDFAKFTPLQRFQYTESVDGTDIAIEDLNADIESYNAEIASIKDKITKAKGSERISLRESLKSKESELTELTSLLPQGNQVTPEAENKVESEALQTEEVNTIPTDVDGNIDYNAINDVDMYADALKTEFSEEDALEIVSNSLTSIEAELKSAAKVKDVVARKRAEKKTKEKIKFFEDVRSKLQTKEIAPVTAETKQAEQENIKNEIAENSRKFPVITNNWEANTKHIGNKDEIILPNGEKISGSYVLTGAFAATPSHNPMNNFAKSEGFPVTENGKTINDRDYEADKNAQLQVEQRAGVYDQRALQTPVIVSNDGVVISGNDRTMSGQLAAQRGTDKAYNDYLLNNAGKYGFTSEQVSAINSPRVVFVPDVAPEYTTETFAKFNKEDKKTQNKTEKAVAVSKTIKPETLGKLSRIMDNYDTLDKMYDSPRAVKDIISALQRDGVIGANEIADMVDGEVLSGSGRDFIENLVIGGILGEKAIRQLNGMRDVRQTIVKSATQLVANKKLGDYSLTEEINDAIDLVYNARKQGMRAGETVDMFMRTQDMFGDSPIDLYGETVKMLANTVNKGQSFFKKLVTSYNERGMNASSGQSDIFTGEVESKDEIINDALKLFGYEQGTRTTRKADAGTEEKNPTTEIGNAETSDEGSRTEEIIAQAEASVDTNPTQAQKEAGNYRMGHVVIDGHNITIENPKGSTRSGVDADGKEWSVEMKYTYGYIKGTKGKDGDHIDIFLSDNPTDGNVFVVDQVNKDGSFDEHKVMYGFPSAEEAKSAYLSNYEKGWSGLGDITEVSKENFGNWLASGTKKMKPFAEYKAFKVTETIDSSNEGLLFREKEEPREMVALHNLDESNLMHAKEMGGLSVPSVAITKAEFGMKGFGDITMILPKKSVDPSHINNPMFSSDAYTKTHPNKKASLNNKKIKSLSNRIYLNSKEFPISGNTYHPARTLSERFTYQLEEDLSDGRAKEFVDYTSKTQRWRVAYALENGMKLPSFFKPNTIEFFIKKYDVKEYPALFEKAKEIIDKYVVGYDFPSDLEPMLKEATELFKEEIKILDSRDDISDKAKDRFRGSFERTALDENGVINFQYFRRLVDSVSKAKYNEANKSQAYDDSAFESWLDKKFDTPAMQKKVKEWAIGIIDDIQDSFYFMDGKKKMPYTLDNITDYMKTDKVHGVEKTLVYGFGNARAESAIQFDSFEEARQSKDNIVAQEEYKILKDDIEKESMDMANSFLLYSVNDTWDSMSNFFKALGECRKKGALKALTSNGFKRVPAGKVENFSDLASKMANMKVPYFESKPQRSVQISEFRGAVVPKSTSKEAIEYLKSQGVEVIKYDPSKEGDKVEKTRKLALKLDKKEQDILFREENKTDTQIKEDYTKAANDLASELGIEVEVLSREELPEGHKRAQGYFNPRTGKIAVCPENHASVNDIRRTIFHEAVAHKGLRGLFGSNFDNFLDETYQKASEDVRRRINTMASRNGWNIRVATEEYLANQAENGFDDNLFTTVKQLFNGMVSKAKKALGFKLSDADIKYVLWKSYRNLKGKGSSVFSVAEDAAMKYRLFRETGGSSVLSHLRNDDFDKEYQSTIDRISDVTGIEFSKSKNSSSWYGDNNGTPIRISNHSSKFTDRHSQIGNKDAIDVNTNMDENAIIRKIGGYDLFENYKEGDKINHRNDMIGEVEFLNYDPSKDRVTVLTSTGEQKSYFSSVFTDKASNNNFEIIDNGNGLRFREEEEETVNVSDLYEAHGKFEYENALKTTGFKFTEAYVDRMNSLKELQDRIANGKEIPSSENAYMYENTVSSRSTIESEIFFDECFKPMVDELGKLEGKGFKYENIKQYVIARSGLERNIVFAWRNTLDNLRKDVDKREIEKLNSQYEIIKNKADKDLSDGEITLNEWKENIDERLSNLTFLYSKYRKKDYSGLSSIVDSKKMYEDQVIALIEETESKFDTKALWERINDATKQTLRKSFESGVMSKELHAKLNNMFKFYIPLRGFDETTAEDVYQYMQSSNNSFNPTVKKAGGRTSIADDPFANIGSMGESAILQGNKNVMKQHLYRFAANNPTKLLTVGESWVVKNGNDWSFKFPNIDENTKPHDVEQIIADFNDEMKQLQNDGEAITHKEALKLGLRIMEYDKKEHIVIAKINGTDHYVIVNGNPRAAQAVNGLLNDNVIPNEGWGKIIKAVRWANRQLAANFTTRNPEFVVSNLIRDMIFSNTAVAIKESPAYLAKFVKNIPSSMSIVAKGLKDRNSNEYFKDFVTNGGETGYTQLQNTDAYKRIIKKELRKFDGKVDPIKAFRVAAEWFSNANRWAEDISRFNTFMTSRQMGRSITRSISDAKEITVNFNRQGAGGYGQNVFKSLYLFFNAAVQSLNNITGMAKKNPGKFTTAMSAFTAAGYMIPILNNALIGSFGGDDDKDAYNNLPDWVRKNNLCLWLGGDKFLTIPLPIELRALYGIGDIAHQYSIGNMKHKNVMGEVAKQIIALSPLDPFGDGGGPAGALTPDAAKPFVQAYITNTDYFGMPVYRESDYNKRMPEFTKAYKSVNPFLVGTAEWLNEASGGDKYTRGKVNLNPARIEHVLENIFGGMAKTISKAGKAVYAGITGEDVPMRQVPMASRFVAENDERNQYAGINERYRYYTDRVKDIQQRNVGYAKEFFGADRNKYTGKYKDLMQSDDYRIMSIFNAYDKMIKSISDKERELETSGVENKELKKEIQQLKKKFIELIDK